ncbi:MAG TPA: HAMP domain-containing protein, partial [Actinobacteria bacterium]|nr:HAMP domain-containing protein [Actinomycetota bacterium]
MCMQSHASGKGDVGRRQRHHQQTSQNRTARRESMESGSKEGVSIPSVGSQSQPEPWDRCVCDYVNPVVSTVKRRPFFQKIIIANTILIALGSFMGYYFNDKYFAQGRMGFVGLFIISSIALSVLINYVLVKLAFRPLDDVTDAMKAIRAGHRGIRVPEITDDPQIEELSRSLNAMLNSMELQRKRAAASVIKAQEEE